MLTLCYDKKMYYFESPEIFMGLDVNKVLSNEPNTSHCKSGK